MKHKCYLPGCEPKQENKYSQNWQDTKDGAKPIFFVNGKRVPLIEGFKLVQDGIFGSNPEHLNNWFAENGYDNYESEKLASDDSGSLVKVRSNLLQIMEDLHNPEKTSDTVWLTGTETLFDRVSVIYLNAGGSIDYLKQQWPEYFGELEVN
jgi:hypothetical protein